MTDNHDEIEFEEPVFSTCECCGALTTSLTRFVFRDDAAFAVYKASFSDTPTHDFVSLLISFGGWGENTSPQDRTAFACRMWSSDDTYNVALIDREESVWQTEYFGRILSRAEGLVHPLVQEVFDLTDHIAICDRPIIDFLNREVGSSSPGD